MSRLTFYWGIKSAVKGNDPTSTRSEVARNLGLLTVAAVGVAFGMWRAYTAHQQTKTGMQQAETAIKHAEITERGHFTDRFTAAVEHLGNKQLPVRLGGIHALWRLAQDAPDNPEKENAKRVLDILCAYVRHPPHPLDIASSPSGGTPSGAETSALATEADPQTVLPDVQAVMTLVTDPSPKTRDMIPDGYRFDFSNANLSNAHLDRANLAKANLRGANLVKASLIKANLSRAKLLEANLSRAKLYKADLSDANLLRTDLSEADLFKTDLSEANLVQTNLSRANLTEARVVDVDLSNVTLVEADLSEADLREAGKFDEIKIRRACQHPDRDGSKLPRGMEMAWGFL